VFKLQRVDKHSGNSHKLKLSMKSLTFSCLICALNLYFAQKVSQKDRTCSRLLERQEVASNAERCSKVVEPNRDRPYSLFLVSWSATSKDT